MWDWDAEQQAARQRRSASAATGRTWAVVAGAALVGVALIVVLAATGYA